MSVCGKAEGDGQNFHFNPRALQLPNAVVAAEVVAWRVTDRELIQMRTLLQKPLEFCFHGGCSADCAVESLLVARPPNALKSFSVSPGRAPLCRFLPLLSEHE